MIFKVKNIWKYFIHLHWSLTILICLWFFMVFWQDILSKDSTNYWHDKEGQEALLAYIKANINILLFHHCEEEEKYTLKLGTWNIFWGELQKTNIMSPEMHILKRWPKWYTTMRMFQTLSGRRKNYECLLMASNHL